MTTELQPQSLSDKVPALLASRRFWAAVGGVVAVVLQDLAGLDEQTAMWITALVVSWIVGDSLRKTQ